MYRSLVICISLLLCLSNLANAQSVHELGIEQGLSNNTVTAFHKDKFGLMWLGTKDGLNRYDGYSFKIFRNRHQDSTSLPDDIINCLTSDVDGNIWVGTQKGLGILDCRTQSFNRLRYVNETGKAIELKNWVNDIKLASSKNVFIACNDVGIIRVREGKSVAEPIPLRSIRGPFIRNYMATALGIDLKGRIWASVGGVGLCRYEEKEGCFRILMESTTSTSVIRFISPSTMMLGTNTGLQVFNLASDHLVEVPLNSQPFSGSKIFDLLVDRKDHLWVATDGKGLYHSVLSISGDQRLTTFNRVSDLSSDAINALYEDELHRKWIGTLRGGINVVDERFNQFKTYRQQNGLTSNFILSFCEDNSKVWIGTDGGGLNIWDRNTNRIRPYFNGRSSASAPVNSNRISSIVKDRDGKIWIGNFGGDGIKRLDPVSGNFERVKFSDQSYDNAVWRIHQDLRGDIWVSCLRGKRQDEKRNRLFVYNCSSGKLDPSPFSVNEDILSIADHDKDHLWLGGFTGVALVHRRKGPIYRISLGSAVRAILQSRKGKLWIATYGRGLWEFDPRTGKTKNYTEEKGLCNNKVLNIQEDKRGNIWVSTNHGISKLAPGSGNIESYYASDGLQSNQFYFNAAIKLQNGEMLFGGIKGFNVFDPDSIRRYHDFPPLIVSDLKVANVAVDATSEFLPGAKNLYTIDRISLPFEKAIFSIEYGALEYSMPEKIKYAYMLTGRDADWNFVENQRMINFSHLREGNYILKIRYSNASGLWNDHYKSIYILITPPWYRTWWAYTLYLIITATGLYLYTYYHKKQTRLEFEVKFIEEINEKKISFFTNVAHELRTPLTLIINPLKDLLRSDGANLELIDVSSIYRNSRRLLSLVDQIMLFKKSESEIAALDITCFNLREVCLEVFICFNYQARSKGVTYNFEFFAPDRNIRADREKFEIILFNLLSNAIKYTPVDGIVELRILADVEQIEIIVADSGVGISPEIGNKLFDKFYRITPKNGGDVKSGFGIGLFLVKTFVELHQGEIIYESELGKGTHFRIKLPITIFNDTVACNDGLTSKTLPVLQEIIEGQLVDKLPALTDRDRLPDEYQVMEEIVQDRALVLLIDDDEELRNYIRGLLSSEYEVLEAANVETGFELVVDHQPDIIVCDVVMPGKSGVEFCSDMKDAPSLSHIPIILLTGSTSPDIKLKGIECGADDYISKPFESDLLVAKIKSLLKGRNTLRNYFFNEITLKNNGLKVPLEYSEFLYKCIRIIESNLDDDKFSVIILAEELSMSRSKLFRKIKAMCGLTGTEFIRYIRLRKSAELMIQTDLQIKEIAYKVGFQDTKYFREQFAKLFKMNPSAFIKKYRGAFNSSQKLNPAFVSQKTKNQ